MLLDALRRNINRWLFRVSGPEPTPIRLVQRRIFVLPTGFGLALGVTLLVMLLASINYTLSLGFALTFLIGGVAWVSIHHAYRNLVELSITPGRVEPVFCGENARFSIQFQNPLPRGRHALVLRPKHLQTAGVRFDIPALTACLQPVVLPAPARGWLILPRLTLETRHPLGLIRAWSLFQPEMRCLVYPAPEAAAPPLPPGLDERPDGSGRQRGREDFAGLRHHQAADSPRHVAWKAVARGGPWRTKEFGGGGQRSLSLDWSALPGEMGTEQKLSRLTRWALEAEATGLDFSLSLPDATLPRASGPAHLKACLRALALHGHDHG